MLLLRADAIYCSDACKMRAYRMRSSRAVPSAMSSLDRWVRVSPIKVPLTTGGAVASVSDPSTWTDIQRARASRQGVGVGFVLAGDGIGCVDLDHCLDGRDVAGWAQEFLDANPDTFTEVSMSGTGLHIWGLLDPSAGRRIRDGRNIEIYSQGRYIALGTRWGRTPLKLSPLVIPE